MAPDIATAYILQNGLEKLVLDSEVLAKTELSATLSASSVNCELFNCSAPDATKLVSLPSQWAYDPLDSTLVMLSHTSGTTDIPKTVRFEHRQFIIGKSARIGQFVESADERLLSALPQSHSSAISHIETAVLLGIPIFVLSNPVGEQVRNAMQAFRPTVVAAFPQTSAWLVEGGIAPNEFPSVRRYFSMGDAVHGSRTRHILSSAPIALH